MYVRAGSPKYVCRKCCNKIPIVDLEGIVRDELKGFFGERNRVSRHLADANRNLADKTAALEAHQREIQKVRDEMARTHRLYLDGGITSQGFGEFYKPAEERLNQLRAELPRLEAEVDLLKVNKLSTDDVVHESATLHERWPSMASDDRRKVVEALVEKVVIGDGEIDITYSYMPTSEELCKNQQRLGLG
jgi:site-specific DNA recombinase